MNHFSASLVNILLSCDISVLYSHDIANVIIIAHNVFNGDFFFLFYDENLVTSTPLIIE